MTVVKNQCDVSSCFLCSACLPEWRPIIATHKKNIVLKKGQSLFKEGDAVAGIYFIYQGNIKVHKKWGKEKEIILRFAKGGDMVGHLGLGDDTKYPVSATAVSPAIACYIDRKFLETTLDINNGLAKKMMRFFANELQESEKRMRNLAHMSVKARVAQAFISLKNQFGVDEYDFLNIELTRQDLASFTGAVYESLFRTINDFTAKNLIEMNGKKVKLNQEELLLKMIQDDSL